MNSVKINKETELFLTSESPRILKKSWTRYAILSSTLLCLASLMANINAFNFTILCMPARGGEKNEEEISPANANQTHHMGHGNNSNDTLLYTAVALGSLLSVVPISMLITKYGNRKVFYICGLLSALATLGISFVADQSMTGFVALRFLQGVAFSASMPTAGGATSAWAPLKEHGLFISTLTTFPIVGTIIAMPISGELCTSSYGWKAVYILLAGLSVVSFTIWVLLYRDNPEDHKFVSKSELLEITAHNNTEEKGKIEEAQQEIPYLSIITTPSILGILAGAMGDFLTIQLVHVFSPIYIHEILQYSVHDTGFAAAVPVLSQFLVKIFGGLTSDLMGCMSETTKLRVFNTLAMWVSGGFLLALAFVNQGEGFYGMLFISIATALFGFNGAGFNKCATLVSRQHSHFVLASIQFLWCLAMLISPILIGFLLQTGSASDWHIVFVVHTVFLFLCNAIFCLLATAKPAPWTDASLTNISRRNTPIIRVNSNAKN